MDEFEFTFLPKALPDLSGCVSKEIVDIYLPSTVNHPYLRIRRSGEKFEITKKQPVKEGDASHQFENTIPLSREEFDELAQIAGKRIQKNRYLYEEGGRTYEIDVFQGDLKGLVLVDIEFNSLEEKATYIAPDWMLADVTQEDFIAGGMLCGKSFSSIESKLSSLGYSRFQFDEFSKQK